MAKHTAKAIADWMWKRLQAQRLMYQHEVVRVIEHAFGARWVYTNKNGNPAISPDVLERFRVLYCGRATWNRYARCWKTS